MADYTNVHIKQSNYENDSKFAYDVNKIPVLAFLECQNVSEGFSPHSTLLKQIEAIVYNL
ncbi:hypothetical protein I4U23_023149 [Adineta vaga]|nr:hypothetical protein I4U23_023149 [Adineta vaga]